MSAQGRKLFLGGLTKTTTKEQLFEAFGRFGQVVDAVVMERNGHPRGFGFVTYKEKRSLALAIAAGVSVDGREVDIKRAVPEDELDVSASKVFVGGLSQNVDKVALQQHFEAFGEVRDAVVMIDRATSRSRGFGFVRFASAEAVETVLNTPHLLDGQWIDVKRAEPAEALPATKNANPAARDVAQKKRGRVGRDSEGFTMNVDAPVYTPQVAQMPAQMPQMDANAASWAMWSLFSIAQQQQQQQQAAAQFPYGMPAFPMGMQMPGMHAGMPMMPMSPMGYPAAPAAPLPAAPAAPPAFESGGEMPPVSEIAALLARMSASSMAPTVFTEEAAEPERAPLGDVANVMSPSKSPTKFPSNSPLGRRSPVMFGSENPQIVE